jgi:hypothetical protein
MRGCGLFEHRPSLFVTSQQKLFDNTPGQDIRAYTWKVSNRRAMARIGENTVHARTGMPFPFVFCCLGETDGFSCFLRETPQVDKKMNLGP